MARPTLAERGFAAAHDRILAPIEAGRVGAERRRLCASALGRVLDIGAGTGANLALWDPARVDHVDACEPSAPMRRRLERKVLAGAAQVDVAIHEAPATGPFPGAPYDTIVCCLVLCTVPDPAAASAALLGALAPSGRLLFLEHVCSPGWPGRLQRATSPAWAALAGGCRLDRETQATLRAAGFGIVDRECFDVAAPTRRWASGTAIRRTWGPTAVPPAGAGGDAATRTR